MIYFRYIIASMMLSSIALPVSAVVESDLSESQIKAIYLYKFASYVEWPSSTFTAADMPITIGILGADEISVALENLLIDQPRKDHFAKVKLLKHGDSLKGIQILFIGQSEKLELFSLLQALQMQPVLTVTEVDNALHEGSIINFIVVDEHIRIEVSIPHAERNGLKISSRLLGVAQRIETGRPL